MKQRHKFVYNNYQFYENDALVNFIERQAAEGYYLCGMIGRLASILKFRHEDTGIPRSYVLYCKYLDEQIDTEIENMKAGTWESVCENIQFVLFGSPSADDSEKNAARVKEKQKMLLGIPLKKSLALISALFFVSLIVLVLKWYLAANGKLQLYPLKFFICIALNIIFLFYFTGDLYDLKAGKGVYTKGIVYFSGRTRFKDVMFYIGDICRLILLLGSVFSSILLLIRSKDFVILLEILRMWFLYWIVGYCYKLKFRRSYIVLLIGSVFLAMFGI